MSRKLIYQMLPRLWGEGKFSSVDSASLNYIKSLGFNYIWYTGVVRHATSASEKVVKGEAGSPYAVTDWYDVNPYMADDPSCRMDEFRSLVQRTHAAGLKVLMDFIPNHVAREYHGAKTPAGEKRLGEGDDVSVHWKASNDFYYYPGQELRLPVSSDYVEFPARASGNSFTYAPDVNDWYETVRLNYCPFYTETWGKMLSVLRFWASMGVDGFRCDMVELVPPEFIKWAIDSVKKEFPSVIFVAEVYEKDQYGLYVRDVGFDLLYDKSGLYDTLRQVMAGESSAQAITWNWQFLEDLQPRMLNFLENHDEQRLASDFFAGSAEAGYSAMVVSLLFGYQSFMLYFGQEIGERGMDNEPFSGVNGRTSIFDWWKVASLQRLYKYVHNQRCGLNSEERAVLKRYSGLLSMAASEPFVSGESYDLCYCQGEGFDETKQFAFLRSNGNVTSLVIANFGSSAKVKVQIPDEACNHLGIHLSQTVYELDVPSQDFVVVELYQ